MFQAMATGWIAGMRTMSALVITSNLIRNANLPLIKPMAMRVLAKPMVYNVMNSMAVGEFVGDKLPETPDRIAPVPLTGRAIVGAISGAIIYGLARRNKFSGALIGGASAIVSAYAMYELRKQLKNKAGVPDLVLALAEDALVVGEMVRTKK